MFWSEATLNFVAPTSANTSLTMTQTLLRGAGVAGSQSANGLVVLHWKVMVHMLQGYLTEKQMPCSFWFYLVVHSARKMNTIPGKFGGKLASPFLLAHGVGHIERTWFPLFSLCYFNHDKDGSTQCTHNQSHTLSVSLLGVPPLQMLC
jgi:hypothetical protein